MSEKSLPPAIFLMGPTAAGKTALAMAIREMLPVELISVDASQVYRGMNIGTAKPSPAELARAPHRLIDIRDPAEPYSAAEFCQDAQREMADIAGHGRIPLLVGGTMFYFNALEQGLTALPPADQEVREALAREAAIIGWTAMHDRLVAIDPPTAGRINPNDPQRIQRALEIHRLTGEPPSQLMARQSRAGLPYTLIKVAIAPTDRKVLHAMIAERFAGMLVTGLLDEVKTLMKRGDLSLALPSVRTVGYRQAWEYLAGSISHEQMSERAIAATRQLAKRQLTWMRRNHGLHGFDSTLPEMRTACIEYLSGRLARMGYN